MTKIRCTQCGGHGWADLSPLMERTLAAVSFDRFRSTAEIRQSARVDSKKGNQYTAIVNRLNVLLKNGLIEMKRIGPTKTWRRQLL